jgi:hypothetical protein
VYLFFFLPSVHATGTPEFKYGTGLSYTQWSLQSNILSTDTDTDTSPLTVLDTSNGVAGLAAQPRFVDYGLELTNTGARAGKQVVMGFVRPKTGSANGNLNQPMQRLFGYKGVHLTAGASSSLHLRLQLSNAKGSTDGAPATTSNLPLAWADAAGDMRLVPGEYEVFFSLGDGTGDEGNERVAGGSIRVEGPGLVIERAPFAP